MKNSLSPQRVFIAPSDRWADGNIRQHYHIESAAWIWLPGESKPEPTLVEFCLEFTLSSATRTRIHLSADHRHEFFVDGQLISRGPDRSDPGHWAFASFDLDLEAGSHEFRAEVAWWGKLAPVAQMSSGPGFILSAEGLEDSVNTGSGDWLCRKFEGIEFLPALANVYHVIGPGFVVDGNRFFNRGEWLSPEKARSFFWNFHGIIAPGPILHPASLPEQLRRDFPLKGVKALGPVSNDAQWNGDFDAEALGEWDALVCDGRSLTIPAGAKVAALVDFDDYVCGYAHLEIDGGKNARIGVHWAESLILKPIEACEEKGNRAEWKNKYFVGFGDRFIADGAHREFKSLWWRSGRWIRVSIETSDEPLVLKGLRVEETRYPYEVTGRFACADEEVNSLLPMMVRGLEACAHETYVDCPYFEQLCYVGDARLQMLCWYVLSKDDRLSKRVIELLDWSRSKCGFVAERYPSEPFQLSVTFSMIWVLIVHDFALWRDDPEFVRRQLPGIRALIDQLAGLKNSNGLLERLPGWSFVDWVRSWHEGYAPGAEFESSAPLDLFFLLVLQAAADLESVFGEPELAQRWRRMSKEHSQAITDMYWDLEKGMFRDTGSGENYSVHSQSLALISGMLNPEDASRCFDRVLNDDRLAQTTVYFRHYYFEIMNLHRHGVNILKDFSNWKAFAELGLKTPPEMADPTRSDCHAWGSHPMFHLIASIAGVRPAAMGFRKVRIAPDPAIVRLGQVDLEIPHPRGVVALKLEASESGGMTGSVSLPEGIEGIIEWGGNSIVLEGGKLIPVECP